jgi:predicted phage tail protein
MRKGEIIMSLSVKYVNPETGLAETKTVSDGATIGTFFQSQGKDAKNYTVKVRRVTDAGIQSLPADSNFELQNADIVSAVPLKAQGAC